MTDNKTKQESLEIVDLENTEINVNEMNDDNSLTINTVQPVEDLFNAIC